MNPLLENGTMATELLAGYGEEVITPILPCPLSGYGYYLGRQADAVLDDLKVRAVFVESDERALLVSADLIGLSVDFCDRLREEIASRFNLPFTHILISCTHTHSGPATVPLRGMGQVSAPYLKSVQEKILRATERAFAGREKKQLRWNTDKVKPIGYNRVQKASQPLDDLLGVMIFEGKREKIYVVNYACHPVSLGVTTQISADFPGRLVKEIESQSSRCVFLQGFCGDIDPVNKKEGGPGSLSEMEGYGRYLAQAVLNLKKKAELASEVRIKGKEKRVWLPYQRMDIPAIEKEKKRVWERGCRSDSNFQRFLDEWEAEARAKFHQKEFCCLRNVPVNLLEVGPVTLVGYPGEVFCELGLKIKEWGFTFFTTGYTNGNVGYLPTRKTYENRNDYAAYQAPKIYDTFPFSPEIEEILLTATRELVLSAG